MEEEKEKNSLTDQPAYQLSGQYTSCISKYSNNLTYHLEIHAPH